MIYEKIDFDCYHDRAELLLMIVSLLVLICLKLGIPWEDIADELVLLDEDN